MSAIKILVAQHKAAPVYSNDIYTPIQVGKFLSGTSLGILSDDCGENISHLNPYFCELTAQYWAWKNINDVDYIGLCHYRRYFKTEFTNDNMEKLMQGYDIILAKRIILRTNILNWYSTGLTPEDVMIFHLYMSRLYKDNPEQYTKFYTKQNWINPANMFVCSKKLFDDFCSWEFSILNDLFSIIPKSPYSREQRLMGFFGESLLPFFAYINKLKVKEIPIVPMIGSKSEYYKQNFLLKLKNNLLFTKNHKQFTIPTDFMVGLEKDGLPQRINALFENKYNHDAKGF